MNDLGEHMLPLHLLFKIYEIDNLRLRMAVLKCVKRMEGGELTSVTLRQIFQHYYKIDVGLYSHGGCFVPYQVHPFTKIGRYCSIARQVRIINRNHPVDFKSMHAMFCVSDFGLCDHDLVDYIPLEIENDVWIGHNAIIMPHVRKIHTGAVIAAGAVVNKDVPPYAIVVGNPSRIVRYRFTENVIQELLASKWWEQSLSELKSELSTFQRSLEHFQVESFVTQE